MRIRKKKMESKTTKIILRQTPDPTNIMKCFILCLLEIWVQLMKRIKGNYKNSKPKKFADPHKTTDLIVRIQQERKHNKPPCGAPRGVVQIEAGGRRSGPCPDPGRRHQPYCPPAPSDQAPPGAPAPRSPEGNEISLEKEFYYNYRTFKRNISYLCNVGIKRISSQVGVEYVVGIDALAGGGDGTNQPRRLQLHTNH
jgi:hypothetical protein